MQREPILPNSDISHWIARDILKDHFYPYDAGISYMSHMIINGDMRISYMDRTGDIIGSWSNRPTMYLNVKDIYNHPVILRYNRDLKIDQIELT